MYKKRLQIQQQGIVYGFIVVLVGLCASVSHVFSNTLQEKKLSLIYTSSMNGNYLPCG